MATAIRSSALVLIALLVFTGTTLAQDQRNTDIGFSLTVQPDSPLYEAGQTVKHYWLVTPPTGGKSIESEVFVLLRYPETARVLAFDLTALQGKPTDFVCRDDGQAITCIAPYLRAWNVFAVTFAVDETSRPYLEMGAVGAARLRIPTAVEVVQYRAWLPMVRR